MKVLGGVSDKVKGVEDRVQALVGSHLSGMSKEEKIAYAKEKEAKEAKDQQAKSKGAAASKAPTPNPNPAASNLLAARERATGWTLDARLVRTAVCPDGQRNPL